MGKGKDLYTAKQFIDAMPGTGGIVSLIAKRIGCNWHTADKYIKRMPSVRAAYQDECESILDLAEAKTIEAIKDGDGQMIRNYLSTKGKHRGYSERTEITGADGAAMQLIIVEQIVGGDTVTASDPDAPSTS